MPLILCDNPFTLPWRPAIHLKLHFIEQVLPLVSVFSPLWHTISRWKHGKKRFSFCSLGHLLGPARTLLYPLEVQWPTQQEALLDPFSLQDPLRLSILPITWSSSCSHFHYWHFGYDYNQQLLPLSVSELLPEMFAYIVSYVKLKRVYNYSTPPCSVEGQRMVASVYKFDYKG